jgi:hypothetical protein
VKREAVGAAAVIPDAFTQRNPYLMGLWRAIFPQIHEQPSLSGALDGNVTDREDDLMAHGDRVRRRLGDDDLPRASSI